MNDISETIDRSIPDAEQLRDTVIRLYEEVFDGADVDADSDFFRMGGDSLMATTLMAALEREFGTMLALSVLLEAPTPRKLAAAVAAAVEKGRRTSLVTVRREGEGPPLFCVHGMEGFSMFPGRLAEVLPGRPIYALRAMGLGRGEVPLPTVEAIAAGYLEEIRSLQPKGPYLILGQCGPCFVAYEMAQQLRQAGVEVAGLIIGDPPSAEQLAWRTTDPDMRRRIIEAAGERVRRTLQRARSNPDMPGARRSKLVSAAMSGAIGAYLPQPYPGETLMLYSPRRRQRLLDPECGLPPLLPKMSAVQIGTSHKEIFQEVGATAAAIKEFLDRVAPLPG